MKSKSSRHVVECHHTIIVHLTTIASDANRIEKNTKSNYFE